VIAPTTAAVVSNSVGMISSVGMKTENGALVQSAASSTQQMEGNDSNRIDTSSIISSTDVNVVPESSSSIDANDEAEEEEIRMLREQSLKIGSRCVEYKTTILIYTHTQISYDLFWREECLIYILPGMNVIYTKHLCSLVESVWMCTSIIHQTSIMLSSLHCHAMRSFYSSRYISLSSHLSNSTPPHDITTLRIDFLGEIIKIYSQCTPVMLPLLEVGCTL
jgi:hypothetical protein